MFKSISEGSIIVTGASSGIGRAVAVELAATDWKVILSGRSEERLAATLEMVADRGGDAVPFPGDLSKPGTVRKLVDFSEEQSPLYGVVAAAGINKGGVIAEQEVAVWSEVLDNNLLDTYRLVRTALGPLEKRGRGHIVIINSVAGLRGFAGNSAYVAAKQGLRGFTEVLRLETRPRNIKVTTIFPGATNTEWWDKQEGEFPRHRMLAPEDVARTVAFALTFSDRGVVEELVVRRIEGDF